MKACFKEVKCVYIEMGRNVFIVFIEIIGFYSIKCANLINPKGDFST